jgi:hypothetical protein
MRLKKKGFISLRERELERKKEKERQRKEEVKVGDKGLR